MRDLFWPKIKEALVSVIPITIIVILLHYIIAPMPNGTFALFLTGAFLLSWGMGFFTLGADIAMMPMGESIGSKLTQSKNLWFIILTCFALGVFITIAEPELQVLAEQVVGISNGIIIMSVALGVRLFPGRCFAAHGASNPVALYAYRFLYHCIFTRDSSSQMILSLLPLTPEA